MRETGRHVRPEIGRDNCAAMSPPVSEARADRPPGFEFSVASFRNDVFNKVSPQMTQMLADFIFVVCDHLRHLRTK
jgi:hypothetical protein